MNQCWDPLALSLLVDLLSILGPFSLPDAVRLPAQAARDIKGIPPDLERCANHEAFATACLKPGSSDSTGPIYIPHYIRLHLLNNAYYISRSKASSRVMYSLAADYRCHASKAALPTNINEVRLKTLTVHVLHSLVIAF